MRESRYEIKFNYPIHYVNQIKILIKNTGLGFHEIFKPRKISSIYLDTLNYNNGFNNIGGFSEREKFRFRFYNNDIKDTKFEIKSKRGNIYEKKVFNLKRTFNISNSIDEIIEIFKGKNEIFYIRNLRPVLFCSYNREYYLSNCKRFRITIDTNIGFSKILPISNLDEILNNIDKINNGVLELKSSLEDFESSGNILNELPLRVNKNSKYELGLFKTNLIDPKNFL